ncbi:E3 ubiquitin-protein ligase TRIM71-like [Mytilus edulis]|uniref:E3 ubiquitin-protein ligase TRIM71-like n=1 Tax=Mytilus edulis TaxID=6550 RepID=UPI0039EFFA9A
MASSVNHVCTICQDDGISNEADTWCTECEVFFCGECEKPHRKSRLSKNHKTMSAEDFQKLPAFMQEISSQCKDHKKKYELYCPVHACPCCVQCITDKHTKCQDFKPLSDILKQVKSSASVELFEKDLKDMKENLDNAVQYLKSRISTSGIQKTKAVEKIRSMKKSIVDYLNKLEQQIIDELGSKHEQLVSNMDTIVKQMEQRASQIGQMQSDFIQMTQYATELQMYVGLKEIEKTTSEAAKFIESLESGDHFDEKNLEVKISSDLQSIVKNVESFGDINVNTTFSTLRLKTGRKDQAQHLVPDTPGIEQIMPSLLRRLTIPKEIKPIEIYACLILPDGKIIVLDRIGNQLLLFSNDGIFIRNVTFDMFIDPCNACFFRNYTLAVTFGFANKTVLVDVEKNKIIETIKLSHYCNGVASDGNLLVISCTDESTLINRNGNSHTILKGVKTNSVALFNGNIYGTNFKQNKVCCYKSNGELLWTFMHHDINGPIGISLDIKGFVYTCSYTNNRIVVVSPDGKTCKTILSGNDGIESSPYIDINRETGMMIVAHESSDDGNDQVYRTASIFKI